MSSTVALSGGLTTVLLLIIPDKYSRKRVGYLLIMPMGISWLLIIFATEHMYIYVARFLCGVSGGVLFVFLPIYVSEISNDNIRGLLGSVLAFALNIGILLAYILGGIVSMGTFAIISLAVVVLYLVAFIFVPESPVYLVRQNRIREAAR